METGGVQLQSLAQQALQERLPHLRGPNGLRDRGDAGGCRARFHRRQGQPHSQPRPQPPDPHGHGFFTPTRILHGPAAVNTEEPQRDRDDFRFYQSHVLVRTARCSSGRSCSSAICPKDSKARIACSAWYPTSICHETRIPTSWRSTCCCPVVDPEVSQGGFHDEWRVYGKPNGDELFSLRQFELAPGAETMLTGPAALVHHPLQPWPRQRLPATRSK